MAIFIYVIILGLIFIVCSRRPRLMNAYKSMDNANSAEAMPIIPVLIISISPPKKSPNNIKLASIKTNAPTSVAYTPKITLKASILLKYAVLYSENNVLYSILKYSLTSAPIAITADNLCRNISTTREKASFETNLRASGALYPQCFINT